MFLSICYLSSLILLLIAPVLSSSPGRAETITETQSDIKETDWLEQEVSRIHEFYTQSIEAAVTGNTDHIRSSCQNGPLLVLCQVHDVINLNKIAYNIDKIREKYRISKDYSILDYINNQQQVPDDPRALRRLRTIRRQLGLENAERTVIKSSKQVQLTVFSILHGWNNMVGETVFPISEELISKGLLQLDKVTPPPSPEFYKDRALFNTRHNKAIVETKKAAKAVFKVIWKSLQFTAGTFLVFLGAVLTVVAIALGAVLFIGSGLIRLSLKLTAGCAHCGLCMADYCSVCCTMWCCKSCWSVNANCALGSCVSNTDKCLKYGTKLTIGALLSLPFMLIDIGLKLMSMNEFDRERIGGKIPIDAPFPGHSHDTEINDTTDNAEDLPR